MRQLTFTVEGLPPAKSEALSMLGAGHTHEPRVRALLEAARAAAGEKFEPFDGRIGLQVEVHTSEAREPSDATNYLGGIADVLELKTRRGELAHLGALATFGLYSNDRQIREVHYRQVIAEAPKYRVRIWDVGPNLDAWYPPIFERLSQLVADVPPLRDLLDFTIGAAASLMRAEQVGYEDRSFKLPSDYYTHLAERAKRMANGTLPWHGRWISGYYFNSGLVRLWQTREVVRDLLDKVRPRVPQLADDQDLKDEAERLKHRPKGLSDTREVTFQRAVSLLEDLVSAIEREKRPLSELRVGAHRAGEEKQTRR